MRPAEVKITRFIASRYCAILLMVMGLLACVGGYGTGSALPLEGDAGFVSVKGLWSISDKMVRFVTGLILVAGVTVLMDCINRGFNLLRTTQILFMGIFVAMQSATPLIVGGMPSSVLMAAVILGTMAVIFTTYLQPRLTRRVFLMFVVMSALCVANYAYIWYILLFMASFSQMRTMGPRMLLAALLGIITPLWINLGMGWITLGELHLPRIDSVIVQMSRPRLVMLIVTVGVTVVTSFLLCAVNMVKIYAYNAKDRALNGVLMLLTLTTSLAILIDFRNAPSYLSLLNCLTAYQVGLFFRVNAARRGYVAIIGILICFTAIYLCNIWLRM
ncbi:MAG: hypothetical protein NC043_09545 [Muribaculaceae bacterium]|nr:hypothetical protein [Muribaculaceae bacterium]